jgi:osmoprotectant transport system ATP-binding protein
MLSLIGVSKWYQGRWGVRDVSLRVGVGEVKVLIGSSGCGKSTLLRLVNGLVQPETGHVEFQGQRVTDATRRRIRLQMGYVIQEGGLFPHLTAVENVSLMARFLKWSSRTIEERIEQLAGLTHFPMRLLGRYPTQLSGGERQRVALMRALMLDPSVLLLDEPLGALDPLIRYELQNELKQMFVSLGKTALLVTHDLSEAAFFADEIVLLRDGVIEQQGTLRTLIEQPATPFVERFVTVQRGLAAGLQ